MKKLIASAAVVCTLLMIGLGAYFLGNRGGSNVVEIHIPTGHCDTGDIKIVHISDTHNKHDEITQDLKDLGPVDLLLHTGDFSADGTDAEFADFNRWLGEIQPLFPRGVFVIMGNHDYKFLNGKTLSDEDIAALASDDDRRLYIQKKLPNATVLDTELRKIDLDAGKSLSIFAMPWYPFQSSPTHPDKVSGDKISNDHDRVFQKWVAGLSAEKKAQWTAGEAWRYDEIPASGVDILATHVPAFGVFDQQPVFTNWGSSQPLLDAIKTAKPRAHLFGHVHAQRGYWEKVDSHFPDNVIDEKDNLHIIGGVQYAKTTNEETKELLLAKADEDGVQFLANSAMMSDRTVQPFAKKRICGKPRLVSGHWVEKEGVGHWYFHGTGGEQKAK